MKVELHKHYVKQTFRRHPILSVLGLLIPPFFIGWSLNRRKWTNRFVTQITEMLSFTFFGYFQKELNKYIHQLVKK